MPIQSGTHVGPYEIVSAIGANGRVGPTRSLSGSVCGRIEKFRAVKEKPCQEAL